MAPAPIPEPRSGASGALSRRIGGLPGWQWVAIVGSAGGLVWYVIAKRKAAAASTSTTAPASAGQIDPTTGLPYSNEYGPAGGGQVLAPILLQQGPPSTPGAKGAPGPAGPAGPRGPVGPIAKASPVVRPAPVGRRYNSSDFPAQIVGLTAAGKNFVRFGTVQNGKIVGGNVGSSGAPVYALIPTPYGPVWRQGFNPAKLKNGTVIGTPAQFKDVVRKAA